MYVTGKVTGKQQTFGSEENAEVFDLMSATMSGSADYTPPVVAFTAPAANLRTTATTVNLTGTVKDPNLGDKVLVRAKSLKPRPESEEAEDDDSAAS